MYSSCRLVKKHYCNSAKYLVDSVVSGSESNFLNSWIPLSEILRYRLLSTVTQDPSNCFEDDQEQFTARWIQGVKSGEDESSMSTLEDWITHIRLSVYSLTFKYFLTERTAYCFFYAYFWRVFLNLCWYIHISMDDCRTLLTSITSKMVRLHLLYALLIYCLGSMGTGEDLFYKVLRTFRRKCPLINFFLWVSWNPENE